MSLGRRWRWTASEKTFAPNTLAPGWVRSTAPSAPPFTLHCAAVTFGVRVRAGMVLLRVRGNASRAAADRPYPAGQTGAGSFRSLAKGVRPSGETLPADLSTPVQ